MYQDLTGRIIAAAVEVHRHLGPGLLESAYADSFAIELTLRGIPFQRQAAVDVAYKGHRLQAAFRADFIVDNRVVVELKSIADILDVHKAQVVTYLRYTGCKVGLLINFNVPVLTRGIKRLMLSSALS